MVALLFLATDGTDGTRVALFVLLMIAILLILVGATIAIVTMYFYWKVRTKKQKLI